MPAEVAVSRFQIVSPHQPAGDQPRAIEELSEGLARGDRHQVLLGATGTGKTSITLNNEVLDELDRNAGGESRSAYIERVLRRHFVRREKAERESRELERIDAAADRLNAEMAEVARVLDTRQQFRVV